MPSGGVIIPAETMNAPEVRGVHRSRPSCRIRTRALRLRDVCGLWTLLPLDNLELDAIAFSERLEAATLNGAEVDEDVRPSLAGNEAVALGVIEPLHGALETCHEPYLLELCSRSFCLVRLARPLHPSGRVRCHRDRSTAGLRWRGASFVQDA